MGTHYWRRLVRTQFRRLVCLLAPHLNPLESAILSAVAAQLAPEGKEILQRQLAAINRIDRRFGETLLYQMRHGISARDETPSFPAQYVERKFATVTCELAGGSDLRHQVDLWLVRGYLFMIQFHASPPARAFNARFVSIWDVTVHFDPMRPVYETISKPEGPYSTPSSELHGWLATWRSQFSIDGFWPPLPKATREALLAAHSITFPLEYCELLEQTDGLLVEDVVIFGAGDVTTLYVAGAEYVLLASVESRGAGNTVVAITRGQTPPDIFSIAHDGPSCVSLGQSFRSAVEHIIAQER
jgi:hypothetical protein